MACLEPGDYVTSDEKTVADLHAFVHKFLKLHPHLAANDFYLSGLSQSRSPVPSDEWVSACTACAQEPRV